MHLTSLLLLLLLLAFAHLYAAAAPVLRPGRKLEIPTPSDFIRFRLMKPPRPNKSFFWTGPKPAPGTPALRDVAIDYALAAKLDIAPAMLTPIGQAFIYNAVGKPFSGTSSYITSLPEEEREAYVDLFWENASEAFAEMTTGKVTVMMEGDPKVGQRPDSWGVFELVERPVLRKRASLKLVEGAVRIGRDFRRTGVKVPLTL